MRVTTLPFGMRAGGGRISRAFLTLCFLTAACSSPSGTSGGGDAIRSVAITSPTGAVVEQMPTQLTATVTEPGISAVPRAAQPDEVTWALVTPSDGQITGTGQFTPSRPGSIGVRLQAAANPAVTVTRQITVDSAAFVSISLVPLIGVAPSDTVRPQVIGVDAVGRDRVPRDVQFQSLNGTLEVLPDGRSFRAVTAGQGQVQATVGTLSASVAVPVVSPYVRMAVTLVDPVIDWAQGARVQVQAITPAGAQVDVALGVVVSEVVSTPGSQAVVGYVPGRLRTVVPPFTTTARRDVGVTARVAFQYRGVADTLVVPLHYRRPQSVSWTLAASGPRTMQIGDSFSLGETVLRDSSGAVVLGSDALGTLDLVRTSNAALVSLSPARVVTALASGGASILQDYREPARSAVGASISVSVAFPPPPAPDLTPIGTGYLKVVAVSGLRPNERAEVVAAVARVEAVIAASTASVVDVNLPAGACGAGGINESVAGIIVYMTVQPIASLGQGGPCLYRTAPDRRPALGMIIIDQASITMVSARTLQDVIVHEILHALGIGSLWFQYGLIPTPLGSDPRYTGTAGIAAYQFLGGSGTVPIENTGGAGTVGSHWRKATFGREIMTGTLSSNAALSRLTIGGLADLGYTVNYARAEAYTLGQVLAGLNGGPPGEEHALHDDVLPPKFMVDGFGRVVPYRP